MTDHSTPPEKPVEGTATHPSASKSLSGSHRPRLVCIDANLKCTTGKIFQLASLFAEGAEQLSMRPILATHIDFACEEPGRLFGGQGSIARAFHVDNLTCWSLSVDGRSSTRRDVYGKPFGGTNFQNAWMRMSEKMAASDQRAEVMLAQWANDFNRLLAAIQPKPGDALLINQCNDFTLLALANALRETTLDSPLQIEAIFHAPIFHPNQSDRAERAKQFASQVNDSLSWLRPHRINLHATSQKLAKQLQDSGIRQSINAIPYPALRRPIPSQETSGPAKILIAGEPKKNQRCQQIITFISDIYSTYLKPKQFCVSTRPLTDDDTPASWQPEIPKSLQADYQRAISGDPSSGIEVVDRDLRGEDYHAWLDTADIGLFLYDPAIYAARCSSVLLDLLARGIPVIVPEDTTLADEVHSAGGNGSIGFAYRDQDEIPGFLRTYAQSRDEIHQRAQAFAQTVHQQHSAKNTLIEMGFSDPSQSRQVA